MALNEEEKDPTFYVDSGATAHITNNPGKMTQITLYKGNDAIFVGNGEVLRILMSILNTHFSPMFCLGFGSSMI